MMAKVAKKKSKVSRKKSAVRKKQVSTANTVQNAQVALARPTCYFDQTTNLPPSGHVTLFGSEMISGANYASDPGIFEVEVDLGIIFNSQPNIQLTRKHFHDPSGNVYDTGDHDISYRWVDCNTFRTFKIIVNARRLNYNPVISYQVTGNIGAIL
jgi:hypothetical protein